MIRVQEHLTDDLLIVSTFVVGSRISEHINELVEQSQHLPYAHTFRRRYSSSSGYVEYINEQTDSNQALFHRDEIRNVK